jgi:hypothetical protein
LISRQHPLAKRNATKPRHFATEGCRRTRGYENSTTLKSKSTEEFE